MTLNEKMAEAIESNIKWDSEDYAIAANECEAIAEEFFKEFHHWCYINDWYYESGDWYHDQLNQHLKYKELITLYKQSLI